jgi:hypothetical protein
MVAEGSVNMRRMVQVGFFVALGTMLASAVPDLKRYLRIVRM